MTVEITTSCGCCPDNSPDKKVCVFLVYGPFCVNQKPSLFHRLKTKAERQLAPKASSLYRKAFLDFDQHVEAVLFPRDICDTYLLTQPPTCPSRTICLGKDKSVYQFKKIFQKRGKKERRKGGKRGRKRTREGRKKEGRCSNVGIHRL